MAVYAKCPEGVDPAHCDYFTPGKEYLTRDFPGSLGLFRAVDDDGGERICAWEGCAHLAPGMHMDWQRIERED